MNHDKIIRYRAQQEESLERVDKRRKGLAQGLIGEENDSSRTTMAASALRKKTGHSKDRISKICFLGLMRLSHKGSLICHYIF